MLKSAWLFVGVVATLATVVAVVTQTQIVRVFADADGVAIVAGTVGFISWGIWTFGTLNIELLTDSGDVVSYTLPSLTMLGIVFAIVPAYIALTGPIEIVSRAVDNPRSEDL